MNGRSHVSLPAAARAALCVALVACACGRERTAAQVTAPPVLLYAVDGLEWSVLAPLIEAGRMPVMAGLMARGTYGYLDTQSPTFSPVIWTTVATGKSPEKHGIKGFVYRTGPAEDDLRFYTSGHRETKAFWNILSDFERRVHCLGWWMTYPAEAINGVLVAQTNTTAVIHDDTNGLLKGTVLRDVEDQVYPPARQGMVMDILDDIDESMDSVLVDIFGVVPHAATAFTGLIWDQTQWAFRADAVYLRVAQRLLESGEPFDVLAVYVSGTDVAAHRFWRYAYPEQFWHPPVAEEVEAFGDVIDDYYAFADRALGAMIAAAPPGTTVIVVSDHGTHAVNPERKFSEEDEAALRLSANHLDAPPGVFIAAGPNIRRAHPEGAALPAADRARPVGRTIDMLPTLLALQGVPLGEDFEGRPMLALIEPEFLARVPVRTVKTHDDGAWNEARRARIKEAADRAERLDQLRSLGYIK